MSQRKRASRQEINKRKENINQLLNRGCSTSVIIKMIVSQESCSERQAERYLSEVKKERRDTITEDTIDPEICDIYNIKKSLLCEELRKENRNTVLILEVTDSLEKTLLRSKKLKIEKKKEGINPNDKHEAEMSDRLAKMLTPIDDGGASSTHYP